MLVSKENSFPTPTVFSCLRCSVLSSPPRLNPTFSSAFGYWTFHNKVLDCAIEISNCFSEDQLWLLKRSQHHQDFSIFFRFTAFRNTMKRRRRQFLQDSLRNPNHHNSTLSPTWKRHKGARTDKGGQNRQFKTRSKAFTVVREELAT